MRKILIMSVVLMLTQLIYGQKLIPFESNGKWGYCDSTSKVVIKPKYYEASKFNSNGMALVKNEKGLKGVINEKGKVLLPTKYKEIYFNPSFAYLGASGGEFDYYYDDYGVTELQRKIKRWMMLPKSEAEGVYSNKLFVVKKEDAIDWYNNKGKVVFSSNKNDELISNYYSPGFTIKRYDKDSVPSVFQLSDEGQLVINNVEGEQIQSLSIYNENEDNTIYYYTVNREVDANKKKLPNGEKRYATALYGPNGNEIISFNEKLSYVRDLHQNKNGEVQVIVQKAINGAEDCAPEFVYGLYNISKSSYTYDVKYNSMSRIYLDRYSYFAGGNTQLFDKILEVVNSDTTFSNMNDFKNYVKLCEREFKADTKVVSYLTMSLNNVHSLIDESESKIKEVKLPEGFQMGGVVNKALLDYGGYGRYGYNTFEETPEVELVIKLYNDKNRYGSGSHYLKLDKNDQYVYKSSKNVNWRVSYYLDSLKIDQIYKDGYNYLLDSNDKLVMNEGFDKIYIQSIDNDPLLMLTREDKSGVVRLNGDVVIDVKYDQLYNNYGDTILPAFVAKVDDEHLLISETGKILIPNTKNELSFIELNDNYYIQETAKVFSRLTNEMESVIEGFYSLEGVKFEGQ